jgi:hypothetical protein
MLNLLKSKHLVFGMLRGSAPFWEAEKRRIINMMICKGGFNLWLTFSSADTLWNDMSEYLLSYVIFNLLYVFITIVSSQLMNVTEFVHYLVIR